MEITFPDGTTELLDYSNLIGATLGAMYDSLVLAGLRAAARRRRGAGAPRRRRLAARLQRFARAARATRTTDFYPNFLEGFPGVACSDSDNPDHYAAWSINGALADARFGYFGRIWTWASSICAEWPGLRPRPLHGPVHAQRPANPVLVVGNHFDPATRYEGAVIVDQLLPRSALLSVHGWGHVSLFLSAVRRRDRLALPAHRRHAAARGDVRAGRRAVQRGR